MISIIIPVYNEEKTIETSLVALKTGLNIPHEIIVSDNASTDQTVLIVEKYADVVVRTDIQRKSIAANRNAGANQARGEFFVFMDSTSWMNDPTVFFTKALERFQKDNKLVALTCLIGVNPELTTRSDKIVYAVFNWIHRFKNNVLHSGEASGKFQMMRREAFKQVGGFNENLITREDGDMFYRLAKIGKTYCDPSLVVFHNGRRAHELGWTRLLSIWLINFIWVTIFGKAYTKKW